MTRINTGEERIKKWIREEEKSGNERWIENGVWVVRRGEDHYFIILRKQAKGVA